MANRRLWEDSDIIAVFFPKDILPKIDDRIKLIEKERRIKGEYSLGVNERDREEDERSRHGPRE